jgi:DNA-binding HxlR family transcriptional regulator
VARKRFDDLEEWNCGIAQALEILGDWWTLLIVRDAFFGVRRFSDFQSSLGISKNILTDRLAHLVSHEILEKRDVGRDGARFEYRLTERGEALLPVLTALRDWSDDWIFGRGNEPVIVKDRASGKRIPKLRVRDAAGGVVTRRELRTEPGPGASAVTRRLFERLTRD